MDVPPLAVPPEPRTKTTEVTGTLGAYFRFNARLSRLCLQFAVAGLMVILIAVLIQIYGRYILNDSPTWTEILALVLVLYVTCLAAAVGVRDGRHIGMESLLTFAPERVRYAAELVVYAGMIVFALFMTWGGAILSWEMIEYVNPGLPISQGWTYLPLALGGILIAMFAVERIVARVLNLEVVPSWH